MINWKKIAGLFFPMLVAFGILAVWVGGQQPCVERILQFQEPFDATTYRDLENSSVAHWGDGYITLNRVVNFPVRSPKYMPDWVDTAVAGDFNNDGWPDFIASSSEFGNVLVFAENMKQADMVFDITRWIDGCNGTAAGPTIGLGNMPLEKGRVALTSGDYDADGDLDFLYIQSAYDAPNAIQKIYFYENRLIQTGTLSFARIDKTGAWRDAIRGIGWSSTAMASVDIEKDGDQDIIVGNRDGQVLKITNRNATRAIGAANKWLDPAVQFATGWAPPGISTVAVADFDKDGDFDMILGGVARAELRFYKNNAGIFTLYKSYTDSTGDKGNDYYDGGATASIACDFDKDGNVDLAVATDGEDGRYGGQVYYFQNGGGEFRSRLIFDGNPIPGDLDLGIGGDFDRDGDEDFLVADSDNPTAKFFFENTMTDVYNLQGVAQSDCVTPTLDPSLYAITRLRILNLSQAVLNGSSNGLGVAIYVSNNDGMDWELYQRFNDGDIRDYAALNWHTFTHYGSKLKWRAVLTAADDNIRFFPNASYETPQIKNIEFELVYIERREYSRTSVAASVVDDSGNQVKLIIGGTFYYPGWQGYLYAYDITNMTALNTSYSELRTVSRSNLSSPTGRDIVAPGVTIRWEAGRMLAARSADSRVIYTAVPNAMGSGIVRADFNAANIGVLDDYLQDVQGDNVGLINFVRGVGRPWKLGDINHSNPVVVGAPNGIAAQMGPGYEAFKSTWSDREKVLFVGANDGMLHCIDILTGAELWAYVPYNLLPKLKNMWAIDPTTLVRSFNRDIYVDGSPTVADVYIDGQWKTILVCGQGSGKGSVAGGGINFYFALDVTDPANPLPIWELTDVATMGESWSVPAIGKIVKDGADRWVAFMGSGYDNNPDQGIILGNVFYAVDLETAAIFWSFAAPEVDTSASPANNNLNIQNTMPGSPALVDNNYDGYADRVYIGDLDGRIWKVDLSSPFVDAGSWAAQAIYTDAYNYPIITEPAIWKNPNMLMAEPRLYFGTGGDDAAPELATYSFVALVDKNPTAEVEWFLGNPDSAGILTADKDVGNLGVGEKVWADPKIADLTVYFSTLTGSIETVDPCSNLGGAGKLYARFITSMAGSAVGGTAFRTPTGPVDSLNLAIKTRSAVTLGETSTGEGGLRKREVYIQEYDSTVQRLEQLTGGLLKINSWRELYNIYKK